MKKQKFKRTFAGILAIVLVCVMAITSYSPLTAYAEDGHFDVTAPVIDDVDTTGVTGTYTKKDNLEFKVHAYDEGGSGLTSINLEFRVEKNDSYVDTETIYYSLSGEGVMYNIGTISYDEKTGYYTLGIPMSQLKQGYKYILNSIEAVDGTGNRTKADSSLIQDKISFVIDRKNNETVQVESVSILDKNNGSVIGKTTTLDSLQFYVALNNTENIERVNLEFRARGIEYDNKVVTCYLDGGKYTGHGTITNYLLSTEEIREYELVTVSIEDADGNEQIIALPNETVTVSVQGTFVNPSSPSNPENKCKVESVEYCKEDGTKVKNGETLTHGDVVKVEVKTTGVTEKMDTSHWLNLNIEKDNLYDFKEVALLQDENDYNLFKGTFEITSDMYPTVWRVSGVYLNDRNIYITKFRATPIKFLVKSKAGDVVVPTFNAYIGIKYWEKNESGNVKSKFDFISKENVPYFTKLSEFNIDLPTDVKCPIDGGKLLGWHVFQDEYDSETASNILVDKGSVEDFVLDNRQTITILPVFDKKFHIVTGFYCDKDGEISYFTKAIEGEWDEEKDLAQISEEYSNMNDKRYGYEGYKFVSTSPDGYYHVEPITKNKKVNITYKYLDKNGKMKEETRSQFLPVDKLKSDTIKSMIESFECPKDSTDKAEFDKWEYDFYLSEYYTGMNVDVNVYAKYKDKYVVEFETDYHLDKRRDYALVEETVEESELKKIAEKYRPSNKEAGDLDIKGWKIDLPVETYNFMQVSSMAQVKNVVIVYHVFRENVSNEDYVATDAKVYNVGDTVKLPDKIGNCKIKKWEYGLSKDTWAEIEIDKEFVIDKFLSLFY